MFEAEVLDVVERIETSFDSGVYKYPIVKPTACRFKNSPKDPDQIQLKYTVK